MRTFGVLLGGSLIAGGLVGVIVMCGSAIQCWQFARKQIQIEHKPHRMWWT